MAPRNFEVNNLNQVLSERDHGRTTFAGFLDELATVTVNGKPAQVTSTGGGAPFKFEVLLDLVSKAALMDRGQIGQADPKIAIARHSA